MHLLLCNLGLILSSCGQGTVKSLIILKLFFLQLLETQTCTAIFQDNEVLANEITDNVIQHFVHCIETHGRQVQYIKFLQTVVKTEGQYIRKTQDMVMAEVS